ncbi:MAG: serine/threonine protein kinase [Planctomycetales bacterium]|nr:serine/threonine protein kinase [Planctomycetales bacterium]
MPCPEYQILSDYMFGRLDEHLRTDVETHLGKCLSCLSVLDSVRKTDDPVFRLLRWPDTTNSDTTHAQLSSSEPTPANSRAISTTNSTVTSAESSAGDFDDELPAVIGDYEVIDTIGSGGMGRIYKARHTHLGRVVAMKLLPSDRLKDKLAVQRFRKEVLASGKLLNHPNVVNILDARQVRDRRNGKIRDLLVMEYIDGCDLSSHVKQHGRLPVAQALEYTLQAARGLEHAHQAGVIHRDIKPSNLMLDDGTIKLLDMGIAHLEGIADELVESGKAPQQIDDLTKTGQLMGSVHFMAPEQALNPHAVDKRADIYSLGCTLYYLLVGSTPYTGQTMDEIVLAHRTQRIPNLQNQRNDVPLVVAELFEAMVAKDPDDRPDSVGLVAEQLDSILKSEFGGKDLTNFLSDLRQTNVKNRRLRRQEKQPVFSNKTFLASLGAAACVILLVVVAAIFSNVPRKVERQSTATPTVTYADGYKRLGKPMSPEAVAPHMFAASKTTPALACAEASYIRVWNTKTWSAPAAFKAHDESGFITALGFSPDGSLLASVGEDYQVRVWDPNSFKRLHVLPGRHTQSVDSLSFSCSGEMLAAASADGLVTVWDLRTEKPIEFIAHETAITCVVFSPKDRNKLLTAAIDDSIKLWQIGTKESIVATFQAEAPVNDLAWAPNGELFASASGESRSGSVRTFDVSPTGDSHGQLLTPQRVSGVTCIEFSSNGSEIYAGDSSGAVSAWNLQSGERRFIRKDGNQIYSGAIGTGNLFITLAENEPIGIVDITTGERLAMVSPNTTLSNCLAVSPNGTLLAVACGDGGSPYGFVKTFDLPSGQEKLSFRAHSRDPRFDSTIRCVRFSPDGKTLATASNDNSVKLWDPVSGELRTTLASELSSAVNAFCFSPDNQFIATGRVGGKVQLWSIAEEVPAVTLASQKDEITDIQFSEDGTKLAFVGRDQSLVVLDVADRKVIKQLDFANPLTALVWNGPHIVVAGAGGQLHFVDAKSLSIRESVQTAHSQIYAAVGLDADHVATAGRDRLIRVWELATMRPAGTISGNQGTILALGAASDGRTVASASRDGAIRVFAINE